MYDAANNKDIRQHRKGRLESNVVKTWNREYKNQVVNHVLYGNLDRESIPEKLQDAASSLTHLHAEMVADTVIGWLNTSVGRCFIKEAFGVDIPDVAEDGTE